MSSVSHLTAPRPSNAAGSGTELLHSRRSDDAASRLVCELLWRDYYMHNIEYQMFFSNHCSHGLIALHELGATPKRIAEFYLHTDGTLEPRQHIQLDKPFLTRENIMQYIAAEGHGWDEYLVFMEHEWQRLAQEHGCDDNEKASPDKLRKVERQLLNEYFPKLAPYIAGHATHPLIQTGYGLILSHVSDKPMWMLRGEKNDYPSTHKAPIMNPLVVSGLAYLCYRGLRLDEGTAGYAPESFASIPKANSLPLVQVLANGIAVVKLHLEKMKAAAKKEPYISMPIGDFQRRMLFIARELAQPLLEVDIQWKIDESNSEAAIEEAKLALMFLYGLSNNDFFMLHGITSFYALRNILRELDSPTDQVLALRYHLKLALAVYTVQGLPGSDSPILANVVKSGDIRAGMAALMKEQSENMKDDWQSIIQRAISTNEEHSQKLVFNCHADHQRVLAAAQKQGAKAVEAAEVELLFYRFCAAKRVNYSEPDIGYA